MNTVINVRSLALAGALLCGSLAVLSAGAARAEDHQILDGRGHFCVFRSMPATSSGACRAMIPVHVGPPFRSMPAGGCDAG